MGRPKGSKNTKPSFSTGGHEVVADPVVAKTKVYATYSNEDAELDRELERIANSEPIVERHASEGALTKEKTTIEALADHVEDYEPATSIHELMDQVHQAKSYGVTAIEATPQLIKHYVREDFNHVKDVIGYFMFHDVRVYVAGLLKGDHSTDVQSVEQKMFGASKVK